MDEWTECLESGGQTNVIYADFEKAFDKVSHKLLIQKLRYYKLNESIILWIESFLCYVIKMKALILLSYRLSTEML